MRGGGGGGGGAAFRSSMKYGLSHTFWQFLKRDWGRNGVRKGPMLSIMKSGIVVNLQPGTV